MPRLTLRLSKGAYDAAFRIFSKAEQLYPDYRPLVLNYTNALLKAGQPYPARDKLREYVKFQAPDITYFDYLTRAEAEAGNQVESSIANAEYYFLTGETRVAIEQLKHLLRQQATPPGLLSDGTYQGQDGIPGTGVGVGTGYEVKKMIGAPRAAL